MLHGIYSSIRKALPAMALTLMSLPTGVLAQDDAMLGEIRMFSATFCPRGWMDTDGRLLSVAENQALFSLLGDRFGGNAQTNFGLPDLRGRVALGAGMGPGRSLYSLGQSGGSEFVTLGINEMPEHSHAARVTTQAGEGDSSVVAGAKGDIGQQAGAILPSGQSRPHENRPPFQVVRYCICVDGRFPERP